LQEKNMNVVYAGIVSVFAGLLLPAPAAHAQSYPVKPVRVIAASSPGSGVDIVSRTLAQRLGEALGQQVVVENRAGAGGNLGAEVAARAAPDGYTLFMATPAHAINSGLHRKLNYDIVRDFAPITLATVGQYVLAAHPSLPVTSVKELVALAKARPGELNYASAGNGNATHLAGELFDTLAKVKTVHVPYKGGGPAMVDLISGQVHYMFPNLVNSLPHIQSGKLRALAVTGEQRAGAAPRIPTVIEAGVPGFVVTAWYGVAAPSGTPQAVIERLNGEFGKVLRAADMKERLAAQGADPAPGAPQEFGLFLRSEVAKWGEVIRNARITAD
jgi:tripartite-type tricarboxylate transporter receptor subunit TctC